MEMKGAAECLPGQQQLRVGEKTSKFLEHREREPWELHKLCQGLLCAKPEHTRGSVTDEAFALCIQPSLDLSSHCTDKAAIALTDPCSRIKNLGEILCLHSRLMFLLFW